jgi:hypothetical protein
MDGEQMTPSIGSALFTDRNKKENPLPIPLWDNFFDYYYVDPPPGKYTLVTPADRGKDRIIPYSVTVHTVCDEDFAPPDIASLRSVRKVAGQGEFDNIHLAPKMVFAPNVVSDPDFRNLNLAPVTMAPFCVHDCFHMHWRWGKTYDERTTLGWDGQKPYTKAGAPMVPGNQGVVMDLLSPASLRYTATAEKCVAGQWQIIMHHGGAYALSANYKTTLAKIGQIFGSVDGEQPPIASPDLRMTWTEYYWRLRYGHRGYNGFERLTWTPSQFALLREVASASAATP